MSNNTIKAAVPNFETVEALQAGLHAKETFAPVDLYPRDGTVKLSAVESRMAELARVEADELILCCSGMAAVVGALEACVENGDIVACSDQLYSQTEAFITNELPRRGIKFKRFNPGSLDDLDRVMQKFQPAAIISETIANYQGASVLDIAGALSLSSVCEVDPYVILDHTLPLSTGKPLRPYLTETSKVVVVESGTKSYTFNSELSGLIYSGNPDILHKLRAQRRTKGFLPNLAGIDRIDELLPTSLDEFDARNTAIAKTTVELALASQQAVINNPQLQVWHPLVDHADEELTKEQYQTAGTPVFFISCDQPGDQIKLTEQLWQHPVIREECELGQSFGFDKTRILYDAHSPFVRIAGGAHTDTTKLAQAFGEVLSYFF